MSNRIIIWLLFVVPWLTVPLTRKGNIRRFLPSAFFAIFACITVYITGIYAGVWFETEFAFPLVICGIMPVAALWVLIFSYGNFGKYMITNALMDLVFAFVIIPWFGSRGLMGVGPYTSGLAFFITIILAVLIYGYQKWQENMAFTGEAA